MIIHVHIVTYNHEDTIAKTLESLLTLSDYTLGQNLHLTISDNNSTDSTKEIIKDFCKLETSVECIFNNENLGFCAGQNQGVTLFLDSDRECFLVLNPDILLGVEILNQMTESIKHSTKNGAVTPLLLQTDEDLLPLVPERIDAAGMILTKSLRHFDRYSGELLNGTELREAYVFGGTGACLLLRRELIEAVSYRGAQYDKDIFKIYPQLEKDYLTRIQLFDEGFFAFRDDADLAFRISRFGFKCVFNPKAIAHHRRHVRPEYRKKLSAIVNALGVRNRFLLQLNNVDIWGFKKAFISGVLFRNILVFFAVILQEWSSFKALLEVVTLTKRALERRRYIEDHQIVDSSVTAQWLEKTEE